MLIGYRAGEMGVRCKMRAHNAYEAAEIEREDRRLADLDARRRSGLRQSVLRHGHRDFRGDTL